MTNLDWLTLHIGMLDDYKLKDIKSMFCKFHKMTYCKTYGHTCKCNECPFSLKVNNLNKECDSLDNSEIREIFKREATQL